MSEGNGFMTRDAALQRKPRRFAIVEIEDWGKFRLKSLTELERAKFERSLKDKKGALSNNKMFDLKLRMIVLCAVDGNGDQLFQEGDIESLREQDSKPINELVEKIAAHCGFSNADIEDLAKNSEATPAASLR